MGLVGEIMNIFQPVYALGVCAVRRVPPERNQADSVDPAGARVAASICALANRSALFM